MTTGWIWNINWSSPGTAWQLRAGQRLVGDGVDKTIIRRSNPNNDLYYVLGSAAGEPNVEISDLTVDGNYWASSVSTISVGGLNCGNLARVRGVKITGTSGNTTFNNGDAELYSLRMSGTTIGGAVDRSVTGGLIENCEVSNIKGGYISGIMPGAGQVVVRNNRIFLPHWTPASTDNPSHKGAPCINLADTVNSIIEGNVTSGGYTAEYSDTGFHTNVMIANNQFNDCIRGIEFLRGYAASVDSLFINNNIIQLSSDSSVSDARYGVILHTETTDGTTYIVKPIIRGNVIKGGWQASTTWGLYLKRVNYPACFDNELDFISSVVNRIQTYFETYAGLVYNLRDQQGNNVDEAKWLSPKTSSWLVSKRFAANDPATAYALQIGDKYIGLQKALTVSLPDAVAYAGKEYVIVNETGSNLTGATLNCSVGGQTINGASFVNLAPAYTSVRVTSNGTAWIRF
jgi:hypothetical protein